MKKILLFLFLFPSVVNAAAFSCDGKVVTLGLSTTNGILQVSNGHGVHYLCKIHTEMNGVPADVCQALYSMLLSAKAAGKTIAQSYNQISGGAQDCASLGNWTTPNPIPYWIEIKD